MADPMDEYFDFPNTQNADELGLSQPVSQDLGSQLAVWGKLVPTNEVNLPIVELKNDEYTAGRGLEANIRFSEKDIKKTQYIAAISKIHFKIVQSYVCLKRVPVVFLEDNSANGTFVNMKKVGKGNKVALENNDIISMARPQFKIYTFVSIIGSRGELPTELKNNYLCLGVLGSGICGEVKMVFSKHFHMPYAMKSISKKAATISPNPNHKENPDQVMNEVKILKALKHPNIITMAHIIDTPTNVYIMLELMEGGELFDRIRLSMGLPEKVAKFLFFQIVSAVRYLHENGITHRDLKPENILLASEDPYTLVKVSDFGMSKLLDHNTMMKTFCGTPYYVAPEILMTEGRGTYTNQVDVWSLGVILYVMLSGYVPFPQDNKGMTLKERILKGRYHYPSEKFSLVSKNAIRLIDSMLTVNPRHRKSIMEVMDCPWLTDNMMRMEVKRMENRYNVVNENMNPNIENTIDSGFGSGGNSNEHHVFGVPASRVKRPRLE